MSRKLKLCFATGTIDRMRYDGTGGVPKLIVNLANDLIRDKKTTILSSFLGDKEPQFDVCDDVKIHYLQKKYQHQSDLGIFKKILFWSYVFKNLIVYKLNKKNRFNYVITCSPALSLMHIVLSIFTKEKVVIWENVALNRYGKRLLALRCIFYRHASLYITSTRSDCDYLASKKIDFRFIPNINYSEPAAFTDRTQRKKHNKFLAVGRLVDQKNFMALLKSLKLLIQKNQDWKLTLVGSGPDKDQLRKFIDDNNLSQHVEFVAHVDNLDPYYKNNDYFLMTSKYEGSPLVLIEAQSFGLPIVSFDCETGPREIIDDKVNGYLVKNGNVKEFANILFKLLKEKDIYESLSRSAYASSQKFSRSIVLCDWLKILK